MFCPKCGFDNPDGTLHCSQCGTSLFPEAPKQQPAAVRVLKALLKCVAVLLMYLGIQSLVTMAYTSMFISSMFMSGELSVAITPDDPAWLELYETIMVKTLENTTQIMLVSHLLTILVLCLFYTLRKKSPVRELGFRAINPVRYVSMALFGIALQIFAVVLVMLLPISPEIMSQHADVYSAPQNTSLLLELISTALLTGIVEEIVFRGMILKYLKRVIHPAVAVVISSLVFALGHPTLIALIYSAVLGIIFGALYVKFNSVVPSIIVHVFFNGTACLLVLIPGSAIMILYGLFITSVPLLIFLIRSFFFRYPTIGDVLLDSKGRIQPRNKYEAEVISEMRRLKELGEITEEDYKRLDADWENAKKFLPPYRAAKPADVSIFDEDPSDNDGDNKNKGDSNEAL